MADTEVLVMQQVHPVADEKEKMRDHGEDVDENNDSWPIEKQLYHAVRRGDVMRVVSLLERNPDLNWVNTEEEDQTALHVATRAKDHVMVALLLGKGAEVHLRDRQYKSPVNIALEQKDKNTLELLANKTLASLEQSKILLAQQRELHQQQLLRYNGHSKRLPSVAMLLGTPNKTHSPVKIQKMEERNEKERKLLENTEEFEKKTYSSVVMHMKAANNSPFNSHFPRNSLMSEMMKVSHFQTIWNIFSAVLVITFMNILLSNYFETGIILDFSFWVWCFGGATQALGVWVILVSISLLAYPLQKLIVSEAVSFGFAYVIYLTLQSVLVIGGTFSRFYFDFKPATGFFIMCEMIRLMMKMHSYIMVNRQLYQCKKNGLYKEDPSVMAYPKNVTFGTYFYFLWAPTLVFQPQYPRNEKISWISFCKHMLESIACMFYIYAIIVHVCMPIFPDTWNGYQSLIIAIFKLMIPGTTMALLAFYGLLHCWMNAFADLLCFADRQFYSDWWNSSSWAMYYRKWNRVVHNFLHRHVFLEFCQLTGIPKGGIDMLVTFILSAIVHEYIIGVAFGFYKPILMLMFAVPGVLFIYLSNVFGDGRFLNIFMWAMLLIGHGMLFGLYARAWHMKYYVPADQQPPFSLLYLVNIL